METAVATTWEFATLIGSEKQIAWAERIRPELIQAVETDRKLAEIRRDRLPKRLERADRIEAAARVKMAIENKSWWWIDNRGLLSDPLLALHLCRDCGDPIGASSYGAFQCPQCRQK